MSAKFAIAYALVVVGFVMSWFMPVVSWYGDRTHEQVRIMHELQEDDPGWNCHTMGNHVCGRS